MKLCVLASGSSGNCTFVSSGSTRLLVDAGLSGRETERRLAEIGESPSDINAICLTHEHSDHIAGLSVLHKRFGVKLYANSGTIESAVQNIKLKDVQWRVFSTGSVFQIGDLTIDPFSVSHDAYEPVGFIISSENIRVGIVTDIGICTHLVRERLRGCQALVIESNHDESLLADAMRPWYLKQRIAGRQGHMSNQKAAEMLTDVAGPDLNCVFLSHLSLDCNRPELAMKAATNALNQKGFEAVKVLLTSASQTSELWQEKAEVVRGREIIPQNT